MKPLRIVYTIPYFYPATQFGGPVTVLADICPEIAKRGHHVRVVTMDLGIGPELPRDSWVRNGSYDVWYARSHNYNRFAPYLGNIVKQPLADAMRDADVLHMHVALTHVNAVARRVAMQSGTPYVYTPHGCLCPTRLRDRRLSKKAFVTLFEKRIIRDAAALHALTRKELSDLTRLRGKEEKMVVVPNALADCDNSEPSPESQFRRKHALPDEGLVVLFLSRLSRVKGLDLLINAHAKIVQQQKNVFLVIAGADQDFGSEAKRLVQELGVSDSVRFTGHLQPKEKEEALRAADLFALTSYSEGLPMCVLEACSYGLPAIITDRCNVPEVAEYHAGIVTQANVDDVVQALDTVLSDEAVRSRMGARGQAMVDERFSMERVISGLESLYYKVAQI